MRTFFPSLTLLANRLICCSFRQVYDIFKVFVFVLVSIHLGACVWVVVIDPCPDEQVNDGKEQCEAESVYDMYAEALHTATIMILGIGREEQTTSSGEDDEQTSR